MLRWLRRLFSPPAEATMPKVFEGPYRVFTKEFDREVHFRDAAAASDFTSHRLDEKYVDLDVFLDPWAALYEPAAIRLVSDTASANPGDIAVTFLLDHSGSLQGERSFLMAATVGVASECLTRIGVGHEVLGFTTRSWHGGNSRRKWTSAGKAGAPGRLCDLLHIVYRTFQDSQPIEFDGLHLMTDPRILKENVDGEALQWAAQRLRECKASRRILIVVSDGAPVDDSTLLFNGPNILDDHLKLVTHVIIQDGTVEIYGVGLHYKMHRYYPQYVVIDGPDDIGNTFLPILQSILASAVHAPAPRHEGV